MDKIPGVLKKCPVCLEPIPADGDERNPFLTDLPWSELDKEVDGDEKGNVVGPGDAE